MEIGRRPTEEGRDTPSPVPPCHITQSTSMHEPSSATKLKVVLPSSAPGGNGAHTGGGAPTTTHTHSRAFPSISLAPAGGLASSIGMPSNGLSLGVSPSRNAAYADDLKLPASMDLKQRKPVKYRECLKNHAANLGGHATDGCGEFMPSGEEGTLEALTCAACNCHRNFHRREVEGEPPMCADCRFHGTLNERKRLDALFPSPLPLASPALLSPPPHMIMAFNPGVGVPDSDEYDGGLTSPHSSSLKKRFRTKFTPEQKEQMASFAQKLGWRIQKHDEEAVQLFCAEVGVKRHVLKVWMHNNKLTMGKKLTCCLTMTPENPEN